MTLTALLCNSSSDLIVNKNKQGLTLAQAFSLDWILRLDNWPYIKIQWFTDVYEMAK